MWADILFALWFFLPAGLANLSPPLANKIPGLNRWHTPMDFGKQWHDIRIFGDHKTWRGFSFGIVVAGITAGLQYKFHTLPEGLGIAIGSGLLMGAGALLGDAVESFVKRLRGIAAGKSWFPFDQIDYIIGGIIASLLVVRLKPILYIYILILYFGLHLVFSYLGFLTKLKDEPI